MMTALLAVALAVIAALTTAVVFLVRSLSKSQDSLKVSNAHLMGTKTQVGSLETALTEFKHSTERLNEALHEKVAELQREQKARKHLEEYRDMLLSEFAKSADPLALSSRISNELRELAKLPGATTTAARGGAEGSAVHGTIAGAPGSDVATKPKP